MAWHVSVSGQFERGSSQRNLKMSSISGSLDLLLHLSLLPFSHSSCFLSFFFCFSLCVLGTTLNSCRSAFMWHFKILCMCGKKGHDKPGAAGIQ